MPLTCFGKRHSNRTGSSLFAVAGVLYCYLLSVVAGASNLLSSGCEWASFVRQEFNYTYVPTTYQMTEARVVWLGPVNAQ
jgi:hypothetical protein